MQKRGARGHGGVKEVRFHVGVIVGENGGRKEQ